MGTLCAVRPVLLSGVAGVSLGCDSTWFCVQGHGLSQNPPGEVARLDWIGGCGGCHPVKRKNDWPWMCCVLSGTGCPGLSVWGCGNQGVRKEERDSSSFWVREVGGLRGLPPLYHLLAHDLPHIGCRWPPGLDQRH